MSNSIRTIGAYAFANCRSLATVTMGSGTERVEMRAFEESPNLKEVNVAAETPPTCSGSVIFDDNVYANTKLNVSPGCTGAYATAPVWMNFKDISESTTIASEV